MENINVIKIVLRCFEMVLGLRVNFHKTKVGSMSTNKELLEDFAKILNCTQMKVLFKYLGIPIGDNPWKQQFCKKVKEIYI